MSAVSFPQEEPIGPSQCPNCSQNNENLQKQVAELQDRVTVLATAVARLQTPPSARGRYYRLICPLCFEKTDIPVDALTPDQSEGGENYRTSTAKCTECAKIIRLDDFPAGLLRSKRIFEIFKVS